MNALVRLNVRCCCQPTKILGTLEVSAAVIERGQETIRYELIHPPSWKVNPYDPVELCPALPREQVTIRLRTFVNTIRGSFDVPFGEELAVCSEDHPLEFWKQLPGFIPA